MIHASLKEMAQALAAKKISSVELTSLFLDRIERLNPQINAFITVDRAKSLQMAAAADARLAAATLAAGQSAEYPLGRVRKGYLVAARGRIEVNGVLAAERDGLGLAIEGEREAVRQAEARCRALQEALGAAQARGEAGGQPGVRETRPEVGPELEGLRRQVAELCGLVRQASEEWRAAAAGGPARAAERPAVERVYVEAEPVEVLEPPPREKARPVAAEEGQARREAGARPAAEAAAGAQAGRGPQGVSLAELEQQARRELERLGAHGANLFKRKK